MNKFDKVNEFINELKETAKKYPGYKAVMPSKIDYHDIENEEQKTLAKNTENSSTFLLTIMTIIFVLTSVYTFLNIKETWTLLVYIPTFILIIFLVQNLTSKTQVAVGKAVWKNEEYLDFKKTTAKKYFVSVAFDIPEKVICQRIPTTKEDYPKIEEGTKILLIKKANLYQARIYKGE